MIFGEKQNIHMCETQYMYDYMEPDSQMLCLTGRLAILDFIKSACSDFLNTPVKGSHVNNLGSFLRVT